MKHDKFSSELTEASAAVQGDRGAMMSLWRRHRRWVAAVLLAHKPRREDLDDLLQEVAMTVVTSIHTVRDPRHVRAWLRTVAINAARSAGRSKRPVASGADDFFEFVPATATTGSEYSPDEIRRMLKLATQLPDHYREPLMLRAVRGMSSRQVGDILDLPPATVDTRVCRARRMLREMVEQEKWNDETDGESKGGGLDGGEGSAPFLVTDSETSDRRRAGLPGPAS